PCFPSGVMMSNPSRSPVGDRTSVVVKPATRSELRSRSNTRSTSVVLPTPGLPVMSRFSPAITSCVTRKGSIEKTQGELAGLFLDVNQTLVAMLGYEPKDKLLTTNLATDIIRDPAKWVQLFEACRQNRPSRLLRSRVEAEGPHTREGSAQRAAGAASRGC